MGLSSNEEAVSAARKASSEEAASDIKPVLCRYVSDKWQSEWEECFKNKLYEICLY